MSTLIKNGTLVNEGVSIQGTITIGDDGRIASIGTEAPLAEDRYDHVMTRQDAMCCRASSTSMSTSVSRA